MKITKLITVVMISVSLTACASKEAGAPITETIMEEPETIVSEKVETPAADIKNDMTSAANEESKEMAEDTKAEKNVESQSERIPEIVYEDNFAVETSVAAAFADKIKEAVAAKNIEALADLTAFPVYVGVVKGGVETREEFIALGAEKIYTPELLEAVKDADVSNLSPSMAGFSISKDGKPNIIFGVVEGRLAISGINYE